MHVFMANSTKYLENMDLHEEHKVKQKLIQIYIEITIVFKLKN